MRSTLNEDGDAKHFFNDRGAGKSKGFVFAFAHFS